MCLTGISTELQSDEAFSIQLEQLRDVMKKRTQLYSAEENALMVMLEGEQQEERRKEQERRVWKERERQLERRRRVDSILFGGNLFFVSSQRFLPGLLCILIFWFVSQRSFQQMAPFGLSLSITAKQNTPCRR